MSGRVVDEIVGRFAGASNATLLGRSAGDLVIYKPVAGTRPLWDFDAHTLAAREVLTYRVAAALGLDLVPRTELGEGPLGPGAVQQFIDEDTDFDPVPLLHEPDPLLWPVAALDLVCNNADRKAGHLLREAGTGRLYAIDHGLTFHSEPKLRTVLWGFAGRRLPKALRGALAGLDGQIGALVGFAADHLGHTDAEAFRSRVGRLLEDPIHPGPPVDRPPVPWPPY